MIHKQLCSFSANAMKASPTSPSGSCCPCCFQLKTTINNYDNFFFNTNSHKLAVNDS